MKKDTKIIIGVVIIALAIIGAISMNSVDVPEKETNYKGNFEYPKEVATEDLKRGFIDGCTIVPELKDQCECVWSYLIEEYGRNGVIEIGLKAIEKEDYIPPEMNEAMNYCINR